MIGFGAHASAANLISNGSFETGTPVQMNDNNDAASQQLFDGDATALPGWTVTGHDIAWIGVGNPFGLNASEGTNFLDLTGWQRGGYAAGAGVEQTISTVTGQSYTLSFDLGNSTNYNFGAHNALTVSAGSLSQALVTSTTFNSTNSWDHYALTFVAQSASTTIGFTGYQATYYIGLDNVAVVAVPEPETYALLLAGMGVIGAMARRRKGQKA